CTYVDVLYMGVVCQSCLCFFFFQAEDGIRDSSVTGVKTCALPISQVVLVKKFPPWVWIASQAFPRRTTTRSAARTMTRTAAAWQIGRASCRERGERSGGEGAVKERDTGKAVGRADGEGRSG